MKDFCNTIQRAKFEHRLPDEIMRYSALFSKIGFHVSTSGHIGNQPRTQALSTTRLAGGKTLVQAGQTGGQFVDADQK
jgi:hypothetical protein